MKRRSFVGLLAGAVFTVLTAKVPVFAAEPVEPDWCILVGQDWGSEYATKFLVAFTDVAGREVTFDLAQQSAERTAYLADADAGLGGMGVRDRDHRRDMDNVQLMLVDKRTGRCV